MPGAELQVKEFIRPLLPFYWGSTVVETDQCIISLECLANDLETIIDLVLEWSQDKEALVTFCKTIIYNFVDKCEEIMKIKSIFPLKVLLNRFTTYHVCSDFVGPTVNSLNRISSGFILFYILWFNWKVSLSEKAYFIFSYYYFIVVSTQSYRVDSLSEDQMLMRSDFTFILLIYIFPLNGHSLWSSWEILFFITGFFTLLHFLSSFPSSILKLWIFALNQKKS